MDLKTLDTARGADAGFEVQLLHPTTHDPLDAFITVHGADGTRYRQSQHDIQRRRMDLLSRGARLNGSGPEVIEQDSIALLASCTSAWRGLAEGDQPIAFSEAAAQKLYAAYPWIKEQVDNAVHRRANFLPANATPS